MGLLVSVVVYGAHQRFIARRYSGYGFGTIFVCDVRRVFASSIVITYFNVVFVMSTIWRECSCTRVCVGGSIRGGIIRTDMGHFCALRDGLENRHFHFEGLVRSNGLK